MTDLQLDISNLGATVFKLPLIAQQLGHRSLEETRRYLHADTPEAHFALDVIYGLATDEMTTTAFAEKWFGSPTAMRAFFRDLLDEDLRTHHDTHHEAVDA